MEIKCSALCIIIFFLVFGLVIFTLWFPFITLFVQKQILLTNQTFSYHVWKEFNDVSIQFQLYFFTITNPNQIIQNGAKPNLVEVGPFTYTLFKKKSKICHYSNGTVSFRERTTWIFNRNKSIEDENFVITTINTPLVITLSFLKKSPKAMRFLIEKVLELTEGYFIKKSVKQLTFDGYYDALLKFASLVLPETRKFKGNFAYFFEQNNTDDGLFTVFTGEKSLSSLNLIQLINRESQLSVWLSDSCNSFKESSRGDFNPPSFTISPTMKIFSSDICRTLTLTFDRSHEKLPGIVSRLYKFDSSNFQNCLENPFNCGFGSNLIPLNLDNLNQTYEPGMYPSGIFDISRCKFGAPFFISQPHFLNADPYYLTMLDGLNPNYSLHDFWIENEPITGANLLGQAKIQLNVGIYKPNFGRFKNIPSIIFPVFWQNYSFSIESEIEKNLRHLNFIVYTLPNVIFYISFLISTIIFIAFIVYIIIVEKNKKGNSLFNNIKNKFFSFAK